MIDPDKDTPTELEEPIEPIYDSSEDLALINVPLYDLYRQKIGIYRHKLKKYQKKKRAFVDMIIFIQETIISQNAIYIQRAEPHSWHQL
jgi:hypothetical protein